jgi:hypothetical protein
VLLTGGYGPLISPSDGFAQSDFGQVFDFATQKFSAPAPMSSVRIGHSAVTLSDGRVLISGGDEGLTNSTLDTTELFDPATGQFSPGGHMTTKRFRHTSVLLKDGRVLLLGNTWDDFPRPDPLNTAELYDPITNQFSRTGDLHSSRAAPAAVLLGDGRVLVVGGDNSNSAEIYDPATGQFSLTASLQSRRSEATALLLGDGRVIVFGGVIAGDQRQVEIYDPREDTFQPTTPLPAGYASGGTMLPGGRVLMLSIDHSWIFDPTSSTYTEVGTMAANHGQNAFLMKDGSVLVFGAGGCFVDAEVFRELQ